MKTNKQGFTLVELMIAVSIIGILAAITYPSYRDSVVKSRRSDAQGALTLFATAMSQWYLENNSSYCGAGEHPDFGVSCTTLPNIFATTVPISGGTPTYNLTIKPGISASTFTLQAMPTGTQEGDGALEVNELGERFWDKNNDGAIDPGSENSWE